MRKAITIGDKEFKYKKDALAHYKAILNISEDDLDIIDIKVSQVQFNTKCFEIFYSNDTSQYISYIMILNKRGYDSEKMFNIACRNSIIEDIRLVKQKYFDDNSIKGQVKCQETGQLSTWTELVVDHRQPMTFSIILDRFKEVERIDLDAIGWKTYFRNQRIRRKNSKTIIK